MRVEYRAEEFILSIIVVLLITIAFFPFAFVYAFTPTVSWQCNGGFNGLGPSGTVTFDFTVGCGGSPFNPSINPNTTLLLMVSCTPSTSSLVSVTDNNGNAWGIASGPQGGSQPIPNQINSLISWIFFSPYLSDPYTGEIVTLNFSPSQDQCFVAFETINAYLGLASVGNLGLGIITSTAANPVGGDSQTLSTFTQPTNGLAIAFTSIMTTVAGGAVTCSQAQSPMTAILMQGGTQCNVASTTVADQFPNPADTISTSQNFVTSATSETYNAKFFYSSFAIGTFEVMDLVSGGAIPSCSNANLGFNVGGSTINTGANTPLTANQTFLYLAPSSSLGAIVVNASTRLSSVSLSNGQTSAKLSLGVYTINSPNPITGANAITRQAQFTWTVTNTAAAKSYNFVPSISVPANGQVAIALGITHTGANVFQSTSPVTLSFSTSYFTKTIFSLVNTTPLMFFFGQLVQPCTNTKVTTSTQFGSSITQSINAPLGANGGNWFGAFFFLLLIPGLFMGVYVMLVVYRRPK